MLLPFAVFFNFIVLHTYSEIKPVGERSLLIFSSLLVITILTYIYTNAYKINYFGDFIFFHKLWGFHILSSIVGDFIFFRVRVRVRVRLGLG